VRSTGRCRRSTSTAQASINDDHTTHAGFNGNGGLDGHYRRPDPALRLQLRRLRRRPLARAGRQHDRRWRNNEVGFGNYALLGGGDPGTTADPIWGIGARYSGAFAGGTFGVGVGYQFTNDAIDDNPGLIEMAILGFSAHVALASGFTAVVNHSVYDMDVFGLTMADGYHTGVGASYTFDALTLHAGTAAAPGAGDTSTWSLGLTCRSDPQGSNRKSGPCAGSFLRQIRPRGVLPGDIS
jgi:outer membrane protein OmpU